MSSAKSGRKDLGISCRATSILVWSAVTLSSEISEPALVLVPLKYTFQFVGLRGVSIFMSVEDIAARTIAALVSQALLWARPAKNQQTAKGVSAPR